MSFEFRIREVENPDYTRIMDAVKTRDILPVETDTDEDLPQGQWPVDVLFMYVNGVSTRGFEVSRTGNDFVVTLYVGACPGDYMAAIDFLATVSEMYDRPVTPEQDDPMDADTLRVKYDADWCATQSKQMTHAILDYYRENPDHVMTIYGVFEAFDFGAEIMEPIAGDADTFAEKFYPKVRRFNFLDQEGPRRVRMMSGTDTETGEVQYIQTWTAPHPCVLSTEADRIAVYMDVRQGDDSPQRLGETSPEKLVDTLETRIEWISNTLFAVPEVETDEVVGLFE